MWFYGVAVFSCVLSQPWPEAYTWYGVRLQPGLPGLQVKTGASHSNPLHGNILDWRDWSKHFQSSLKKYSAHTTSLPLHSSIPSLKWWFNSLRMWGSLWGISLLRIMGLNELWWVHLYAQPAWCAFRMAGVVWHACVKYVRLKEETERGRESATCGI